MKKARYFFWITISFTFLLVCLAWAPLIGSTSINLRTALAGPLGANGTPDCAILFGARLPRILLAALAGAALAAAGAAFQALLRNPLATPYTLGVSSGASFGAVLVLALGIRSAVFGLPVMEACSFASALGTIYLVYKLADQPGRSSSNMLLLAGVTISFFFAALIMFLQYLSDFTQTYQIIHWLMGGLDVANYKTLLRLFPIVVFGLGVLMALARDFNLLSAGEEAALARGVNVERTRKLAYASASLITAAIVSAGGPIGFVGLIVPHTMRLLVGSDHRILLPCSALAGGGFLIVCDTVARTLFAPTELPIGVLTAILGGPFFLVLLFRSKRNRSTFI